MMLTCQKQSKFQNYIFLYIFSVQFISRMDGIEFPSWRFSLVLPRYQGRVAHPGSDGLGPIAQKTDSDPA